MDYGIKTWGNDNFFIEDGKVKVNTGCEPSLIEIIQDIRKDGIRGPILLRFPHLIQKQIRMIYKSFADAKKEFSYEGNFSAVYPLKVNQFPNFVKNLVSLGQKYHYGLEAGSKAELLLAMAYNNPDSPIRSMVLKTMR